MIELKRILIIDDEKDITDSFAIYLRQKGFHVDSYNDPAEALQNFDVGAYDMALLDIRMPKMNGFEVYRGIRKVDKKIRLCFFTAFEVDLAHIKEQFPDIEASCIIPKSILPADMANLVKQSIR